jgi:hypothetical protein
MLDQSVYLMEPFQVTDKFSRGRLRTSTDKTRVAVGSGSTDRRGRPQMKHETSQTCATYKLDTRNATRCSTMLGPNRPHHDTMQANDLREIMNCFAGTTKRFSSVSKQVVRVALG